MNVKGDEADKSWQLTQFPCVSDYASKQCLNNSFLGRQALADINCRRDFTTPLKICTFAFRLLSTDIPLQHAWA